jgi:hypothetical protein
MAGSFFLLSKELHMLYKSYSPKPIGVSKDRVRTIVQPGDTIDLTSQDVVQTGMNMAYLTPAHLERVTPPVVKTPAEYAAELAPVIDVWTPEVVPDSIPEAAVTPEPVVVETVEAEVVAEEPEADNVIESEIIAEPVDVDAVAVEEAPADVVVTEEVVVTAPKKGRKQQ